MEDGGRAGKGALKMFPPSSHDSGLLFGGSRWSTNVETFVGAPDDRISRMTSSDFVSIR